MTTFVTKSFLSSFFLLALIVLGSVASQAQTTLVAYNFNAATAGTPCTASANLLALNVTSTFSMVTTTACTVPQGTATSTGAFSADATSPGQAVSMSDSSGTNTKYFQFDLGGADLSSYVAYKVYFQAQRSNTGATTVTLATDPDCTGTYTNFGTTMTLATNGSFSGTPTLFDLSSVLALNFKSTNCFRLLVSGASGTGTLRIDNFQVQAFIPTASSVALSGRVTTFEGNAISRARVSLVDGNGAIRYAFTNPFGYYSFADVAGGSTYVLSVRSKQYEFAEPTRVVSATGDVSDVDFVALPSLQEFFSPKIFFYKQE